MSILRAKRIRPGPLRSLCVLCICLPCGRHKVENTDAPEWGRVGICHRHCRFAALYGQSLPAMPRVRVCGFPRGFG
jgi:hypothetical protein